VHDQIKTACQIACRYDIQPDTSETSKNALTNAVLTGDPEIVKEIMMIGGSPNNEIYDDPDRFWFADDDNMPDSFYKEFSRLFNGTFDSLYREYKK